MSVERPRGSGSLTVMSVDAAWRVARVDARFLRGGHHGDPDARPLPTRRPGLSEVVPCRLDGCPACPRITFDVARRVSVRTRSAGPSVIASAGAAVHTGDVRRSPACLSSS